MEKLLNYSLRFLYYLLLNLIFFSCTGTRISKTTSTNDDNVNRQFWTADWSPDDSYIAVGGVDSVLRIYHAGNLKLYKSFFLNSWIHVIAWNPDGKTLAIATLDKYVVLLNIESADTIQLDRSGGSRAIGWNHNGQLLAVGELEGSIQIWDQQGTLLHQNKKYYGPDYVGRSYLSLDWHPSENIFIATNNQISLFDSSGKELNVMEHNNKQALMLCTRWHPSGEFFVVGDYGHNWEGENVPSLLHFRKPDGSTMKSAPGSKAEYRNISWNKSGTMLATASDVLRIWTSSGDLIHESKSEGSDFLWGIDWNKKGDRIVTASKYKTITIWDNMAKLVKRIKV